jgi:hypothetical protein
MCAEQVAVYCALLVVASRIVGSTPTESPGR